MLVSSRRARGGSSASTHRGESATESSFCVSYFPHSATRPECIRRTKPCFNRSTAVGALDLENRDFVTGDRRLGRAHLLSRFGSQSVRPFLACGERLLILPESDGKSFTSLPVDQQDGALPVGLNERDDVLAEIRDPAVNVRRRSAQGSNPCVHRVPPRWLAKRNIRRPPAAIQSGGRGRADEASA